MVWLSLSMTFRILSLFTSKLHNPSLTHPLPSFKAPNPAPPSDSPARQSVVPKPDDGRLIPTTCQPFWHFWFDSVCRCHLISLQYLNSTLQYHAISLNISIEEFIKNYEATAAMLPYCQLHDSLGAQTHNFRRSPAPNSVEEHISRYARPTQNKSNHDQYQSGPHRNSLMPKTFLACSNMFKDAQQKLSKSTQQTHLQAVLYSII